MSENQRTLLRNIFPPLSKKLRVHDPFDILEAIFFIVYTGCQWSRMPLGYTPYKTVYYHYRSWSCSGYYSDVLRILVQMKQKEMGQSEEPTMSVIDSHSARTGLPHAVSGIDGGKKIKGFKRQLATDKNGFPLEIITTTANVHDVRGGEKLVASLLNGWNDITLIKADLGYRGMFKECPLSEMDVTLYCVKSNFGTAELRPIHGRWVVERTFSWLQNYRRMMRNYEQHLLTARAMALLASVFFHAPLFRLIGIFDGMAVLSGQNPDAPVMSISIATASQTYAPAENYLLPVSGRRFSHLSSVTMPASLPQRDAKITRPETPQRRCNFMRWGLNCKRWGSQLLIAQRTSQRYKIFYTQLFRPFLQDRI